MISKRCPKCEINKPISDFTLNKSRRDGLDFCCRECKRDISRQNYLKYNDRIKNRYAARRTDPEIVRDMQERSAAYQESRMSSDPLYARLRNGAFRARQIGLPSENITGPDLLSYWTRIGIDTSVCYYSGEPLGDDWHIDHKYPLSRVGSPGHVLTNLVPCSAKTNRDKRRLTSDEYVVSKADPSGKDYVSLDFKGDVMQISDPT